MDYKRSRKRSSDLLRKRDWSEEERKRGHSELERKRRDDIKIQLAALHELLPLVKTSGSGHSSRIEVFNNAAEFINKLRRNRDMYRAELQSLRQNNRRLEMQVSNFSRIPRYLVDNEGRAIRNNDNLEQDFPAKTSSSYKMLPSRKPSNQPGFPQPTSSAIIHVKHPPSIDSVAKAQMPIAKFQNLETLRATSSIS